MTNELTEPTASTEHEPTAEVEPTNEPTALNSTTLRTAAYDPARQRLTLTFTSGSVYEYSNVPSTIADDLIAAESKGRYFNAAIRAKYPFARVS